MGFLKMKLLQLLKALLQRSVDERANNQRAARALNSNEALAAQIDAWVNEGGSTGARVT